MNKNKAKAMAKDNSLNWGEIKLIVKNCNCSGKSNVNSSLTKSESVSILMSGISDKDDNEVPSCETMKFNSNEFRMTMDGVIVMNIFRECL